MKFKLGCQINYNIAQDSTFVFNIRVAKNEYQNILEETLQIQPSLNIDDFVKPLAENRYFRVSAPTGSLQLSYKATVELSHFYAKPDEIYEVSPDNLPLEIIPYLFPSRYCQSDRLMQFAQSEFGDLMPDYSRVTAICNWIYEKVTYLSGSTNSQTSAYDTAIERAGVCRDFAHLGIALCRALNIPARFVAGYAWGLEPPDFHAYFEAFLGDRWYLFDPTRLVPLNGTVRIGTGRDAGDVSFATLFGPVQMERMQLFIEPDLQANTQPQDVLLTTTDAIATV